MTPPLPLTERAGATKRRRAEGLYPEVVRFADRVQPVRDALQRHGTAAVR